MHPYGQEDNANLKLCGETLIVPFERNKLQSDVFAGPKEQFCGRNNEDDNIDVSDQEDASDHERSVAAEEDLCPEYEKVSILGHTTDGMNIANLEEQCNSNLEECFTHNHDDERGTLDIHGDHLISLDQILCLGQNCGGSYIVNFEGFPKFDDEEKQEDMPSIEENHHSFSVVLPNHNGGFAVWGEISKNITDLKILKEYEEDSPAGISGEDVFHREDLFVAPDHEEFGHDTRNKDEHDTSLKFCSDGDLSAYEIRSGVWAVCSYLRKWHLGKDNEYV